MKLINESINQSFERTGKDKLPNLGIGKMGAILKWLDDFRIKDYQINDDLTININNHDVYIDRAEISELPNYIKFNKIYGSFRIVNSGLTTLKGFPSYVRGKVNCEGNLLKTLEFITPIIGDDFYCGYNDLKNLDFRPEKIDGIMFVTGNKLLTKEYTLNIQRIAGYQIDITEL